MDMKKLMLLLTFCPLMLCACTSTPTTTDAERHALVSDSNSALQSMLLRDPSLQERIDNAFAYAVFPEVGKGGLIVGGAFGRGTVVENGKLAGYVSMSQGSIGGQIGGRSFSQLVVFETARALAEFKDGKLKFGAEATAVALDEGVSANTRYHNGFAVFALPRAGLMADASVSGQAFTFQPTKAQPERKMDDRFTAIQIED
jgi:lipid-binding SYLF domain-containing protein